MTTPLPESEQQRLEALRRYQILDTPPDESFDHITALAADLFHVPIAIVSLVDYDRIWFKSHHGLEIQQISRSAGLCASAMLSPEVYHLRDALKDPHALTNPLVAGELGFRFYAAAPLRTIDGFNLGTLCVVDRQPRELASSEAAMLKRLAGVVMDQMELRLAARKVGEMELERQRVNEQLRKTLSALAESEDRFRDLFEEAPIAYVHEDLDSRFIRANPAAMSILGIKPEELSGTFGKDFVPDSPDAQQRLRKALESINSGTETRGVMLELRRKDNGNPVWIHWWSKPDPGGKFTRTMFLDITDRVLMEQGQMKLQAQNDYLAEEIQRELNFGDIIGESSALRKVKQQIQLVAPTDSAVLISGESGTGKELVARAIHERSLRKERALIKVNCGAIPDNLFESDFFGHARGAFTGAIKDKPGRFELADGGTLFLDEIGELSFAMQAKLLRVLQEHEIERVGETRTRKVNVRIIAASNRDLQAEVVAGRFRQALFYRLSVFPIEVAPLRQRREDIPKLAAHFVCIIATRMNRMPPRLTKEHAEQLGLYDWPGNIRELQNVLERALILSQGGQLQFELPKKNPDTPVSAVAGSAKIDSILTREEWKLREHESISQALKQTGGKIFGPGGAAELLRMKPTTLASRVKALGLNQKPMA